MAKFANKPRKNKTYDKDSTNEEEKSNLQDSEEACSEMPSENKENSPPSKSKKRTTRAAAKAAKAAVVAAAAAAAVLLPKEDKARGKHPSVYKLNASINCCTRTKYNPKQDKVTKCKASDETNEQVRKVNAELLKRSSDDCKLSQAIICYHNPLLLPEELRSAFTKSDNITKERIIDIYQLSKEDIVRFNQYLASEPRRSDGNASDDARDAAVDRADDEADESASDKDYVEGDESELDHIPDDFLDDSAHDSDEDLAAKEKHSQKSLEVSIFLLSLT